MSSVAIIDIGSNSIKLLVARCKSSGRLEVVHTETIDARISAGISRKKPRLGREGMARGLAAIQTLLASAAQHTPTRIRLVATSAVRDAVNGAVFRRRVRAATGHHVRVLSGWQEANLIGRGLLCDPALARCRNFYVFDLGGGSLECLAFRRREVDQAVSLPLGCVRLTEKFVSDVGRPFTAGSAAAIADHTRAVLAESGFHFDLAGASAVFAGGSMTTVRAIYAQRAGRELARIPARVTVARLRSLLADLAPLSLARRKKVPGLPPARADVFPTALVTILTVADAAGVKAFQHSLYNLRWGLAAELLDGR